MTELETREFETVPESFIVCPKCRFEAAKPGRCVSCEFALWRILLTGCFLVGLGVAYSLANLSPGLVPAGAYVGLVALLAFLGFASIAINKKCARLSAERTTNLAEQQRQTPVSSYHRSAACQRCGTKLDQEKRCLWCQHKSEMVTYVGAISLAGVVLIYAVYSLVKRSFDEVFSSIALAVVILAIAWVNQKGYKIAMEVRQGVRD